MWSEPKIAMTSALKSSIRLRFWSTASAVPRYQPDPKRICGGTTVTKKSGSCPLVRHATPRGSMSDCDLYWTSTEIDGGSEVMKFDSTKSTSPNRPPNGTADLDRSRVGGWSRPPLPAG